MANEFKTEFLVDPSMENFMEEVEKASGSDGDAGAVTFAPNIDVTITVSPSEVESEGVDAKDAVKSLRNWLKKSGEGSRGGKVTGHTKSGKPIYDTPRASGTKDEAHQSQVADAHSDFTAQDHQDAARSYLKTDNAQWLAHQRLAGSKSPKPEERKPSGHDWRGKPIFKGGEGSRGGKIAGHTKSGKPIYEAHSSLREAGKVVSGNEPGGSSRIDSEIKTAKQAHLSQHADYTQQDHKDAAALQWKNADTASDAVRAAAGADKIKHRQDRRVSSYAAEAHQDAAARMPAAPHLDPTAKHLPAAGASGLGTMFGPTVGTGYGQGAAFGHAVGDEAASSSMGAPTAVIGQAQRAGGAALTSLSPAPAQHTPAPHQAAAPAAPHAAGGGGGGGGGVGQPFKSIACKACDSGECKDHEQIDKAMTSRSLYIPVYMRQSQYDPNGIMRSATTQTSRAYSAIAQPVTDTMASVAADDDVRLRRTAEDFKRSQHVANVRAELHQKMRPRSEVVWGGK